MLFRYTINMDIFVIGRLEFYQASKIFLVRQTFYLVLFVFPLETYRMAEGVGKRSLICMESLVQDSKHTVRKERRLRNETNTGNSSY